MAVREVNHRGGNPSADVIGVQFVQTMESGRPQGYDASKRIKRSKRYIITDASGLLVCTMGFGADIQDCDDTPAWPDPIGTLLPSLRHVFSDGGYAGWRLKTALAKRGQWIPDIV